MSFTIKEGPPNFLTLYLDEMPWKVVSKPLFQNRLSSLSYRGNKDELEKAFFILECQIAKNYSVFLLSKKAYFALELKKKLTLKKFSRNAIDEALAFLKKGNFLKEEALIEAFIRKKREKGYSASFAKRALKEKSGISLPVSTFDETEDILRLFQKKFKTMPSDPKEKKRLLQFFLRRGFSYERISSVFQDLIVDEN